MIPLSTSLYSFSFFSPCCKIFFSYIHIQNKGNSLEITKLQSLDISLSLKVPNIIYLKDSFSDYVSCQMGDNHRELAFNICLRERSGD